jgi:hypothetical protein
MNLIWQLFGVCGGNGATVAGLKTSTEYILSGQLITGGLQLLNNIPRFHNVSLTRIFTESRSRCAELLQKARGKGKRNRFTVPSFIIIFLRFNPLPNFSFFGTVILSGPILLNGPFCQTTGKTYPQDSMKVFSQI